MYRKALLGVVASLSLAHSATAEFLRVTVEPFVGEGWLANGYGAEGLVTWRVYADFRFNNDGVIAAYGITQQSMSASSTDGSFYNADFDSLTAPQDLTGFGVWENQWDTYVTINATDAADDETLLTVGFGTNTNQLASNWISDDVGWLVLPDSPQGLAIGQPPRVLLGQFTVAEGEFVSGRIGLQMRDGTIRKIGFGPPAGACREDLDNSGVVDTNDIIRVLSAWGDTCDPVGLCSCSSCDEPCDADVDGSGEVDFGDVSTLLFAWGSNDPTLDLNCSGVVDNGDLLIILAAWGTQGC